MTKQSIGNEDNRPLDPRQSQSQSQGRDRIDPSQRGSAGERDRADENPAPQPIDKDSPLSDVGQTTRDDDPQQDGRRAREEKFEKDQEHPTPVRSPQDDLA